MNRKTALGDIKGTLSRNAIYRADMEKYPPMTASSPTLKGAIESKRLCKKNGNYVSRIFFTEGGLYRFFFISREDDEGEDLPLEGDLGYD